MAQEQVKQPERNKTTELRVKQSQLAVFVESSLTKQEVMKVKPVEPKTAVLSKQSALVALTKRKRSMIESTN